MSNNAKPNVKDATLIETKAWPAAGATNYSDSFDLAHVSSTYGLTGVPCPGIEFKIELPVNTALESTKYARVTAQESADDSSFTDVVTAHYWQQTGATGTGAAAKTCYWKPNADIKRYVRFKQEVESGGGTLTGDTVTYSMVF